MKGAEEEDRWLRGKSIVDGKERNGSVTSFVDDVAKKVIAEDHTAEAVEKASNNAHEILRRECEAIGVEVNGKKRVAQPWIAGRGKRERR